ncbi:MAG: hypothetical protein WBM75_14165 [Polyangiales bacterium]|jgi:hypothetical protein
MTDDVIEHLRNNGARLRAKALFRDPGDSLSVRIPGREGFLFMTPDRPDPTAFPFATTGVEAADLHARIYRSRDDAGGVLIGQTQWSSALASIGARVPTLFDEQARHIGPAGRPIAAGRHSRLLRALEDGRNVAIYGERRICIGTTPSRVVFNAELFEKCAKAFVITHAGGDRIRKLPLWVRYIARARLRRDQKRAALSYAAGRIPERMDAYF